MYERFDPLSGVVWAGRSAGYAGIHLRDGVTLLGQLALDIAGMLRRPRCSITFPDDSLLFILKWVNQDMPPYILLAGTCYCYGCSVEAFRMEGATQVFAQSIHKAHAKRARSLRIKLHRKSDPVI